MDSYLTKKGFKFIRNLGEGGFGIVDLYEKDDKKYAIKFIDSNRLIERSKQLYKINSSQANRLVQESIGKEITNVQKITEKGPSSCKKYLDFVLTYDVFKHYSNYYFISEPMTDDLKGFFLKPGSCTVNSSCPQSIISKVSKNRDELIIAVICQLIYGVYCLHQIGLIHGDLKPRNIFIDGVTGKIKIADFGGSASLGNGNLTEFEKSITGETLQYSAPERFDQNRNVHPKVDVWSLGVTILELVAKDSNLIVGYDQKNQQISEANFLAHQDQVTIDGIIDEQVDMSDKSKEKWIKWLLRHMLQKDSEDRIGLHELIYSREFNQKCNLLIDVLVEPESANEPIRSSNIPKEFVLLEKPKTSEELFEEFEINKLW